MKVNDFQEIIFDTTKNALLVRVNTKSEYATTELVKEAQYHIVDAIKTHKAKNLLINVVDLRFPMSPELQMWVNEFIIPLLFDAGIMKLAYIMPTEFIEKLSIEQLHDEVMELAEKHDIEIGTSYFDDEAEAFLWFSTQRNNLHLIG